MPQYRTLDARETLRWISGWTRLAVAASLTDSVVVYLGILNERSMEQAGQLYRMVARIDAAITAQNVVVTAYKRPLGGAQSATAAVATLTSASQIQTWQDAGSGITYSSGDSLAVKITTPLGFLPVTANLEISLGVVDR